MSAARPWNGAKWCRHSTRLAIYLRDGLACVWCDWTVEDGASLTLDHLTPYSKGGTNAPHNLVTACKRCNDTRGNKSVVEFATRFGKEARAIRAQARRAPRREEARALLAVRSTVRQVLAVRSGAAAEVQVYE